jgi:hypothetical protein
VTVKGFAVGKLILLPWVPSFDKSGGAKPRHCFDVSVKVGASSECLPVLEPTPLERSEVTEAGECVLCCPFWLALRAPEDDAGVQLQLKHGEFVVPLGGAVPKDAHLKAAKTERTTMTMTVPYLINEKVIQPGETVWARVPRAASDTAS